MRNGKLEILRDNSLAFYCPGCDCHHSVNNSWSFNGDYDKPTFSPSLITTFGKDSDKRCHLFIREGKIEYLSDCTHELKGQTIDLKYIDEYFD